MRLQYQLSNGRWMDCGDRTEEFLDKCVRHSRMTLQEVQAALASGRSVRNDPQDWYSNCRCAEAANSQRMPGSEASSHFQDLRCKTCKQVGRAGQYPFSTLASSGLCDDCL